MHPGVNNRPTHSSRHCRCQPSEQGAHGRPHKYVTRVVHARMQLIGELCRWNQSSSAEDSGFVTI
jgi:hypothetical protein